MTHAAAAKPNAMRIAISFFNGSNPGALRTIHLQYHAEQDVRASGLEWTIIRPSMIHGPGGEFMNMEARWARRTAPPFLFMPYFGAGMFGRGGAGALQPVYVGDVEIGRAHV